MVASWLVLLYFDVMEEKGEMDVWREDLPFPRMSMMDHQYSMYVDKHPVIVDTID